MVQTNALFLQLAIVLGLAVLVGYVIKFLKLPLVAAYLLAGVLISLLPIFNITTFQNMTFLPDIGITFVLFFVGMELDLGEIKMLGKQIFAASLGQIVFAFLTGLIIATAFGFGSPENFFLGVGLSFSSTIVVIKLLLEKKDLSSLYGKLSIGILLVEDLVAILVLMAMTMGIFTSSFSLQNSWPLVIVVGKGALLFLLAFVLSRYVLARVFASVAGSAELLFLTALAWCVFFVTVSLGLGFSVAIGAFLAGVALANSPFHFEIQGKVKPLRDFFVTLFFVYLGSRVVFADLPAIWPLILLFTAYALVVKPLVFLLILGSFGFRKHTIFQTAVNLSQISEFSLIVMVVGVKMGVVSEAALTVMALTGVLSILTSSIMIASSRHIYPKVSSFVGFFVRGSTAHHAEKRKEDVPLEDHVILVGAHRMGGEVMKFLKRESIPFLVLDFNPEIIKRLSEERIHALYGDLGDPEILEFLNLEKAKLVISTAQNLDDNLMLLSEMKRRRVEAVVIARAASVEDARMLYEEGADYVILPEIVSGDFIAQVLRTHWPSMEFFKRRPEIELSKLARSYLAFE